MLTKKQWQWFADNHQKVRNYCVLGIVLAVTWYVLMIVQMMLDKGKSETPWRQELKFLNQFDCSNRYSIYSQKGPEIVLPKIVDANGWLLEWHYTNVVDAEWYLKEAPDCLGALLADDLNDPNPFVIILFDYKTHKPIYRIARIDDVVKK